MLIVAFLIGLFSVVSSTEAQVGIGSGVVISPGQPPILVTPTGDGTVAVLRPGQESFWFRPPQSGSTMMRLGQQQGFYIPFNPAPLGSTPGTPYGITLPGHPSVLDRPLAPFGITLPSSPEPSP
jgi:hypothetical protein